MSRPSELARLVLLRPGTWLQALAYSAGMFVLVAGIGLASGLTARWLLTAAALSLGTLLAGLLHVASRPN